MNPIYLRDDRTIIEFLKNEVVVRLREIANGTIGGRTKDHFMAHFGLRKATYFPSGLPHSRALDRALQELRKDGKVAFKNRQWELTACEK